MLNPDKSKERPMDEVLDELSDVVDFDSAFIDTKSNRLMSPLHKLKENVELLKKGK